MIKPEIGPISRNEKDSIDRPEVDRRPINAADVSFSADNDGWSLHECSLMCADNAAGTVDRVGSFDPAFFFQRLSVVKFSDLPKRRPLPPIGDSVNDLDVFVAWEAEADEPFAVE